MAAKSKTGFNFHRYRSSIQVLYFQISVEHPFPPEIGVDLTCANTIIYEMSKLCMAIIFPFYNISSSNFAVILILARCFQLWR